MKILSLEASGTYVALAALQSQSATTPHQKSGPEDLEVRVAWSSDETRALSRELIGRIDAVLRDASWNLDAVDAFAVGLGPGSWTSLRVVLATAKTLTQTRGWKLCGVPTFDAIARAAAFALCHTETSPTQIAPAETPEIQTEIAILQNAASPNGNAANRKTPDGNLARATEEKSPNIAANVTAPNAAVSNAAAPSPENVVGESASREISSATPSEMAEIEALKSIASSDDSLQNQSSTRFTLASAHVAPNVVSLDSLLEQHLETPLLSWQERAEFAADALIVVASPSRAGEIYSKVFRARADSWTVLYAEQVGSLGELAAQIEALLSSENALPPTPILVTGESCASVFETLKNVLQTEGNRRKIWSALATIEEVALHIGRLAWARLAQNSSDDPLTLQPLYVAPSAAERNLQKPKAP